MQGRSCRDSHAGRAAAQSCVQAGRQVAPGTQGCMHACMQALSCMHSRLGQLFNLFHGVRNAQRSQARIVRRYSDKPLLLKITQLRTACIRHSSVANLHAVVHGGRMRACEVTGRLLTQGGRGGGGGSAGASASAMVPSPTCTQWYTGAG